MFRLLKEMFPEVPEDEIHKVYLSEAASVDRSVERLISISETSGAKEQQLKQTSGRVKAGYTRSNKVCSPVEIHTCIGVCEIFTV